MLRVSRRGGGRSYVSQAWMGAFSAVGFGWNWGLVVVVVMLMLIVVT